MMDTIDHPLATSTNDPGSSSSGILPITDELLAGFPEPLASPSSGQILESGLEIINEVKPVLKTPRKSPKKQKPGKSGLGNLFDPNSSSIPSPSSSINSSSLSQSRRGFSLQNPLRFSVNGSFFPKAKDKSLSYVNYLNAFANSLTVHPPVKRAGNKNSGQSSKLPGEDDGKNIGHQLLDFENSSSLGATLPYIPDFDRDRCSHVESFCPFSKREGYAYCEKHLLDDKSLPFVPCAFQRTDSNPCPYPARMPPGAGGKNRPQRSKEALCPLHIEKCMQEVQTHMNSSANAILSTMDGLAEFNVNSDKGLPPTTFTDLLDDLAEPQTRENLETYLRATAKDTYATDSSSGESVVDEKDLGLFISKSLDTDDELDSEDEEPLKYCQKYSVEELARLLRCKLAKQRELLVLEVRLQEYKLKDARARYLTEVTEERTFLPSVHVQAREDAESQAAYRDLRTRMRVNRRRPKLPFMHARKPVTKFRQGGKLPESISRCVHSEPQPHTKSSKCKNFSLPFSRHCLTHILEDKYQYLYKKCAWKDPELCSNPILRSMGIAYCYLHVDLLNPDVRNSLDDVPAVISSTDSEEENEKKSSPTTPEEEPKKSKKRLKTSGKSSERNGQFVADDAAQLDDMFDQQENINNNRTTGSAAERGSASGRSSTLIEASIPDL